MRSDTRGDDNVEWLIAPEVPREKVPEPSHIRTTWLAASQASLREAGHGAAYEAKLEPRYKSELLGMVAGLWMPMDVALAHYRACDALGLPASSAFEIGRSAMRRTNTTMFALILRMAQGSGVTPWTVLAQTPRFWERMCKGGGQVSVAKLGPKEARLRIDAFPVLNIPYNRASSRGIVSCVVELFCDKAYVKEAQPTDARSMSYRISWA